MALTELIAMLQSQGHKILYSSALVHSRQAVTVERIDLQALAQALADFGLELQARDDIWVVARGAPLPAEAAEPPAVEIGEQVLESVIVTGTLHHFPNTGAASSTHSFTAEEMRMTPTLASDAMRVSLRLPGVSSIGVSAKPRIRGGLPDELLVIQDGVELLEPFHLADYHSAYSSIDYHTIESLDIYTGGFPARYGNRMSGVMDIRNQWQEDQYNTNLGLSTFAEFINTRGESGGEKPRSWFLSYRQGDLSKLTDYIETKSGEPEYRDGTARMSLTLSERLGLAFGGAYAQDDIVFRGEDERAASHIDTYYLWSTLDWQPSASLRGRLTFSGLDFDRKKDLRSFEDEPKGGFMDYRQKIRRVALRNDWNLLDGATLLELGWQAEYSDGEYDNVSLIDRGVLADILGNQRFVARNIALEPDGWSGGAYLQAEWQMGARLTVQPSLRWDFQDYYLERDAQYQLAPRLGLAYDIDETMLARLSVGRFYQPEGIQELQVIDGLTRFFAPQHADQLVAGLEWQRGDLEMVADIYYKRYGAQKGRFENIFNPFVLLPEMEPDRVGLNPSKAVARGFDLQGRFQLVESLGGHLRYSYMNARDRLDGQWVDRRWDQRHTLNADLTFQRGSFSASAAVTWHSGWRSSKLPDFVPYGTVVPVESVLNNTELRDYFSLDVGIRKAWEIGRTRLQVYADISNVTARHNQAGIDFDIEELDDGYEIQPDQETVLGRVTSVGVTLSF